MKYPDDLVNAVIIHFNGWNAGGLNPVSQADMLLRLNKAVRDIEHYASWHYVSACPNCPRANSQD